MRLFRRTRKLDPKAYDPRRPHPYIDATDAGTAGIAASSLGMQSGVSGVANMAVTDRVVHTFGCAVPGCGKAAAEDIHAPAEE
ncbi:MAG TPA: hypothetical protein VGK32_23595 [Vicinamibacterales bacterium]